MADRRVLLGTGAVVVGMSAALLSLPAVAVADPNEAASGSQQAGPSGGSSPTAAPTKEGRGTGGSARSAKSRTPAPAAAGGSAPSTLEDLFARVAAGLQPSTPNSVQSTGTSGFDGAVAVVRAPRLQPTPSTPVQSTAPAATAAPVTASEPPAQKVAVDPVVPPVLQSTVGASGVARSARPAPQPASPQALASVSSLPVSPATPVAPASGLLATAMLNLLSGLGVQQRAQAATSVTPTTPVTTSAPPPLLPATANLVTGVQVGHSTLAIPGAFIGDTVPADWYFPTQADGSVKANGVIWLQHGFGATNTFYSELAKTLAQKTNSIVVAPTLSSIPFTFSGGCLNCASSAEAAAEAFLDPDRKALVASAVDAGYTGDLDELKGKFVFAGHSAGGGFATAAASDYLAGNQDASLVGVVMFDGVSNGASDGSFAQQVTTLKDAGKPIYQIAAPAQAWNAFGATTNALLSALGDTGGAGGTFAGVVLTGGSHVDSMLGVSPLFDAVLQLVTGQVPAGNTAATYTLSTGWINDMYTAGTANPYGPSQPGWGLYAGADQQIIMGPTAALALPSPVANQLSFGDKVLTAVIDAVGGLFGFSILPTPVNTGANGLDPNVAVKRPPNTNGVTGVRAGNAVLNIPCGPNGYAAPATWYFPTQADGSVQANGVIWLQHGFLGFTDWYADTAQALAQETNSIVVVPQMFWFDTPLCPGCFLGGDPMREAAAKMFQGPRSALNVSANAAGFQGVLPEKFILSGHSAGGNFATAVGALITDTPEVDNLLGVVMFDGVSRPPAFTDQLQKLIDAGVPDYQIAAPPQSWNAYGVATEAMYYKYRGEFYGVQIDNGSHTDVMGGNNLFADLADIFSAILVKPSPPGAKEAVRTFANGWVNDIYGGYSPTNPKYGIYGDGLNPGSYTPNQPISMGQAGATTLPAPPPVKVDPNLPPTENYLGTWYEQGSVKQFFSIGLVNTKAVYSLNPDGSIKVQNSGNYFGPNGPQSNITGSAVPVNQFNTRLNVGFFFGQPDGNEPGNYWILDYAPDYSWAIVSDSSGASGFILTRDQQFPAAEYDKLVARAKQLGVRGNITPTRQFPATVTV